ncbi:uncharacterized protein LOC111254455 isoform X2 [Varroa destructor]|uniref:Uncharacterized protein n=1 Tax=Varroa destructor TaxID=109461 RepID=A0A7M7KSI5_VARDE|nr:uncharacterized protein LOC111254455 isoform X2 [Varroa destructor]
MQPIVLSCVALVALVGVQCDRVFTGGLTQVGTALAERSAASLLSRTLSSFARATKRSHESNKDQEYTKDVSVPAHQLLDNSTPPVMTASASNQQAIKTITGSLTPNRSDGSRFSYSTAWGALPECAAQQVCSALYVRLNRTQPLCQCSSGQFKEPCSTTDYVDEHSIKLISSSDKKKAYNLVKVCEPVMSIRRCKSPQDWQLLALQSTRTEPTSCVTSQHNNCFYLVISWLDVKC